MPNVINISSFRRGNNLSEGEFGVNEAICALM
nr:MAG TPA: hypothetical protein [Caudoviricetes sp.]